MYPCTNALCVGMSDTKDLPCPIHREHPNYRPSQPPVVKVDHWKIDDDKPLHNRRSDDELELDALQ